MRADEYTNVFKNGHFLRRNGVVKTRFCENKGTTLARLGLIVPKKGNRLAVRRNRIKRLIRDRFRLVRCRLKFVDIVIHVTGSISDAQLAAIVDRCFEELATSAV